MVSVLVIGDPHFKVSNVNETDAMVTAIVREAHLRKPKFIVVLGDVLDRHETIHVSPLTRSIKFLALLKDIAPTYVLIGNHDLKNNRQYLSEEHPFTACKYWGPNMTIVDTTTQITVDNHTFTFLPYVPPGFFVDALDVCGSNSWQSSTCIFAHQEFKGCQMGAIISEEGDEWPLNYPYVVSGHIHDFQELQPNIMYTGTPIQHAFGDRHDKSIVHFTFSSPTERTYERIDLMLPKKHIVRLMCGDVPSYVPQTNCELKITIKGTSGEIKAIMKHPNIESWKKAGHKINYKDVPIENMAVDQSSKPLMSRAPMRYSQVLFESIAGQPRLGLIYNSIFGSVKVETKLLQLNIKK